MCSLTTAHDLQGEGRGSHAQANRTPEPWQVHALVRPPLHGAPLVAPLHQNWKPQMVVSPPSSSRAMVRASQSNRMSPTPSDVMAAIRRGCLAVR